MHPGANNIFSATLSTIKGFFPTRITPQLKELYWSTSILNFAVSLVLLFEPIYLYTLGFRAYQIMAFYFFVYAIYFFIIPVGGNYVREKGFQHGIAMGSLFLVLYYIFLYLTAGNHWYLIGSVIALALQKTFYWPGYHAEFAFFGGHEQRGREISNIVILTSVTSIAGPLIGAALATWLGFPVLFSVAIFFIIGSNIPLFMTRETFRPSHLPYRDMYRDLVDPKNRRYFTAFLGYAEELIALTIWPIVIFVMLSGNILEVGWLAGGATLATTVIFLIIGQLTDSYDRHKMMKVGTILLSLSWFFRLFISGVSGIFLLDSFYKIAKNIVTFPLVAGMYEHAMKEHLVRTVLFFEMSLTVGKMLTALILTVVFYWFGDVWNVAFVLAGAASLLYLLLVHRRATFSQS